jgi:ATP-dependent RNA helicase DeaD
LYFPIGRSAQVRPGDLVGAITGETGLAGKQIGSIEIADKFSLVEVPEKSADDIIRAMKKTTIKGRKVVPRRERFQRFER